MNSKLLRGIALGLAVTAAITLNALTALAHFDKLAFVLLFGGAFVVPLTFISNSRARLITGVAVAVLVGIAFAAAGCGALLASGATTLALFAFFGTAIAFTR